MHTVNFNLVLNYLMERETPPSFSSGGVVGESFIDRYSDYDNIKFCLCVGTCSFILRDSVCNSVAFPFRSTLVNILNSNLCACEGEH